MIIAVSTHKGGAGKTTIATNIACSLSKTLPKKKILLMDLDGQCGVSMTFGDSPKKYVNSLLGFIHSNKKTKINEIITNNYIIDNETNNVLKNLYIIFGEPDMRWFDHIINNNINVKENLMKTLEYLDSVFDFIIIDTPPSFSAINLLVFKIAKLIIAPFEPERQNVEGVLDVVKETQKPIYVNKPFVFLLPNKFREKVVINRKLMEFLEQTIKNEFSNNNRILISSFKLPNSTQFNSVCAKEKKPLILSKSKSKTIINQKEIIKLITKEIIEISKKIK